MPEKLRISCSVSIALSAMNVMVIKAALNPFIIIGMLLLYSQFCSLAVVTL